jgi:N-acetyl-anhydromuramyl-L-alanine amidase AmpD
MMVSMANSSEYADLKWVPPASYSSGRPGGPPRFIVIHTTEGSSHSQSAEDGAAYDARRTDGTSTHYFVDDTSVVQCVRTSDRAHTAGYSGNMHGIQYELCARASYGRAWWLGGYGTALLKRAAAQCARDAKRYNIPVKRITPADLTRGYRGFVGHVDVTNAWHEVDHTDPGASFPWDVFLNMVNQAMNPAPAPTPTPVQEDDMAEQSYEIPHGYAFAADGETLIDKSKVLALGTSAVGWKGHPYVADKKLYLSVGGDFSDDGAERLRVAIHNGSGWTVKIVTVKDASGRMSLEVPAAGADSAFKIGVSRVAPEVPGDGDGPLFLLVEIR